MYSWRTSNVSDDVQLCPISSLCVGNSNAPAAGYCGAGLNPLVPYCSQCLGYPAKYLDVATCASCSDSHYALLGYVGALLLLLLGTQLFARCAPGTWLRRVTSAAQFLHLAARRASLAAKAK